MIRMVARKVLDPCPDDLRELMEEIGTRGRGLVTTDESSLQAKPSLDPAVVEGGQDDRCLSDPPRADQCD